MVGCGQSEENESDFCLSPTVNKIAGARGERGRGGGRERERETFVDTQQVTEESLDKQQMTGEMCQEDEIVDGEGCRSKEEGAAREWTRRRGVRVRKIWSANGQ